MHEAPQRNLRWSRSTAAMNARNTGPPAPRQTIPAAKEHELKTLKVPANPAQQRNNEGLNFAGRSCEYRYRDSNPGFRRERASEHPAASRKSPYFQGKYEREGTAGYPESSRDVRIWFGRRCLSRSRSPAPS